MITKSIAIPSFIAVLSFFSSCPFLSDDTRVFHHHVAGDTALNRGDYALAESEYKAALHVSTRNGSENPNFILASGDLAKLYSLQKRDAEAEVLLKQRVPIAEKLWATDPKSLSTVYYDLALFYLTRHRYDYAKPQYDQLLALKERAFGSESPEVADTLELFAVLFRANGHNEEAIQMEARARQIALRRARS